jgi:hypothetical protein
LRVRRRKAARALLRPREAAIFAALADAYCAPAPAFPPVHEGDALVFVDGLVANSPRVNRAGLRVILRLVQVGPLLCGYRARFTRLAAVERGAFLQGLDKSRWFLLRVAARLLKTITIMSYYGDARMLRAAGYDAEANLARARSLRTMEGRP